MTLRNLLNEALNNERDQIYFNVQINNCSILF
jgi:hypothetical protein